MLSSCPPTSQRPPLKLFEPLSVVVPLVWLKAAVPARTAEMVPLYAGIGRAGERAVLDRAAGKRHGAGSLAAAAQVEHAVHVQRRQARPQAAAGAKHQRAGDDNRRAAVGVRCR